MHCCCSPLFLASSKLKISLCHIFVNLCRIWFAQETSPMNYTSDVRNHEPFAVFDLTRLCSLFKEWHKAKKEHQYCLYYSVDSGLKPCDNSRITSCVTQYHLGIAAVLPLTAVLYQMGGRPTGIGCNHKLNPVILDVPNFSNMPKDSRNINTLYGWWVVKWDLVLAKNLSTQSKIHQPIYGYQVCSREMGYDNP